jgi:acetyl-CoA acetyltransferase family protein
VNRVFIVDALRTPIGRHGGALASVRPDDLAATVLHALPARDPGFDRRLVDDVVFGDANGAGEDNRNVARMALLLAGYPTSVPGTTVNRLCGSGMEAVLQAARQIRTGDADCCVAGGVESMSRAPWVVLKPEVAHTRADAVMHSTTIGWRMTNPRMPVGWTASLGQGAEILAERYGISRTRQDEFALASHEKASAAWTKGLFAEETVAVPGHPLERDESIRDGSSLDLLAQLPPAFRPEGTVTAANSSPLNDGAAALLLASAERVREMGREPLAEIVASGLSALDPPLYGIGPVEATAKALKRAGIGWQDLAVVELNEAFAAQALACLAEWDELDPKLVNPLGGAIAIGHPLGCSGARLVATLAWQLRRRGGGYGLATMCIGVGQGIAMILKA